MPTDKTTLLTTRKKDRNNSLTLDDSLSQETAGSSSSTFARFSVASNKGRQSKGAASVKSMTPPSVASKLTRGSTSNKSVGSRIIGRIKGVRRRKEKKEKKKKTSAVENSVKAVPETVNARTTGFSNEFAGSNGRDDDAFARPRVASLVHVILFLMDPKTRRFEILLLDFDASKARVRDVLTQIRVSAKEEVFRTQRFSGIADQEGCEMIDSHRLTHYTSEWAVTIAIPDGMTSRECAALASPILNDPRVTALLQKYKNNKSFTDEGIFATNSDSNSSPTAATADESAYAAAPHQRDSATITYKESKMEEAEVFSNKSMGAGSLYRSIRFILAICALVGILNLAQSRITAPLAPGDVLSPGEWRSRCGFLSLLPEDFTGCRRAAVEMGHDGVLNVYNGRVAWQAVTGSICTEGKKDCVEGAFVRADGRLLIGGANVTLFGIAPDSLTPWPFMHDPLYGDRVVTRVINFKKLKTFRTSPIWN